MTAFSCQEMLKTKFMTSFNFFSRLLGQIRETLLFLTYYVCNDPYNTASLESSKGYFKIAKVRSGWWSFIVCMTGPLWAKRGEQGISSTKDRFLRYPDFTNKQTTISQQRVVCLWWKLTSMLRQPSLSPSSFSFLLTEQQIWRFDCTTWRHKIMWGFL